MNGRKILLQDVQQISSTQVNFSFPSLKQGIYILAPEAGTGNEKTSFNVSKTKKTAVSLLFINRLMRYVARWIAEPDGFVERLKEQNAREKRFRTDVGNTSIKYLPKLKPVLKT